MEAQEEKYNLKYNYNEYGDYGWRIVNNTEVYFGKYYWKPIHYNLTDKEKIAISKEWKEYINKKEII